MIFRVKHILYERMSVGYEWDTKKERAYQIISGVEPVFILKSQNPTLRLSFLNDLFHTNH